METLIIILIVLSPVLYLAITATFSILKLSSQVKQIKRVANRYGKELAKQRMKLIQKDRYGDLDSSKWIKEMSYFYQHKVLSGRFSNERTHKDLNLDEINRIINRVAMKYEAELRDTLEFDERMTGYDYEAYCANLLKKSGWNAEISKASGDQGVDIIARKDGNTVAIQCKKNKKNIGNKAVQEISAGKHHYHAEFAAVVTNSDYTKSAKELAISTGVFLLHHSQLVDFNIDGLTHFDYD